MSAQLALDFAPRSLTPQESRVLGILHEAGGAWVSGVTFVNLHVLAYSQRIGSLKRKGYAIESTGRGGVARYRLV